MLIVRTRRKSCEKELFIFDNILNLYSFLLFLRVQIERIITNVIVVEFATILILNLIQTIYYSSANTNETSELVSH